MSNIITYLFLFGKFKKPKNQKNKTYLPCIYISISMYSTWLPKVNSSTSFFVPSMIPNPSSIYRKKSFGHFNLKSCVHFFFSSSCEITNYKLARVGAKLVPMIIPKICWKYSLSKVMRLLALWQNVCLRLRFEIETLIFSSFQSHPILEYLCKGFQNPP